MNFSLYETILIFLLICISILLLVYCFTCNINKNIEQKESFVQQCDNEREALRLCQEQDLISIPILQSNLGLIPPSDMDIRLPDISTSEIYENNQNYIYDTINYIENIENIYRQIDSKRNSVNNIVNISLSNIQDTYKNCLYNFVNDVSDENLYLQRGLSQMNSNLITMNELHSNIEQYSNNINNINVVKTDINNMKINVENILNDISEKYGNIYN
tara:strand:+ start:2274 stop:2921 length:648 start_codon:yes stop_codon:yes gene_type:complete